MRNVSLALVAVLLLLIIPIVPTSADEYDDISNQLAKLKESLDSSQKATKNNEGTLASLNKQLDDIKAKVFVLEKEIDRKTQEVKEGDAALAKQHQLLNVRAVSYYKNSSKNQLGVLDFLTSRNISATIDNFFYQKTLLDEDRRQIVRIVTYVKDLEEKKASLEKENVKIQAIKKEVSSQSTFMAGEVAKSKKFESELQSKIASLTARQTQILAQKLSSLNLPQSLGSGPLYCTDDRKLDPGFRPAFAFYTFGIPHRVGMNQYGALGRARAGQDFKAILNAYFNNVKFECRSTPNKNIKVSGFGEMKVEEYLKGIYEMPGDWPVEALKAQVVAARTYAVSYVGGGDKEICTTQSCQVYKGGSKGGNWEEAVKQTGGGSCSDDQGLVMISNDTNDLASAWYSSTFGGYEFTSADVFGGSKPWTKRMRDTNGDVNSLNDLFDKAYDKDSPCFYSAQGFRTEYGKSAWLKSEEVADIANVLLLAKRDSSTQSHLGQTDKPEGDTWDKDKVKSELRSRGGNPFNSVTDVQMGFDLGGGRTTNVTVVGDAGSQSFDPVEWKNFFNLRAPANIQIVGPLFNTEKK